MACQVIKGDERMCRNYARKGMTCCYSHRVLENTQFVSSIYDEFIENMNFVLKNETEFKLQERRIRIFKVIDTQKLPKGIDWHQMMEAMNRKLLEDDVFYRHGVIVTNPF